MGITTPGWWEDEEKQWERANGRKQNETKKAATYGRMTEAKTLVVPGPFFCATASTPKLLLGLSKISLRTLLISFPAPLSRTCAKQFINNLLWWGCCAVDFVVPSQAAVFCLIPLHICAIRILTLQSCTGCLV